MRKGTCKHYNGVMNPLTNGFCDAGIRIRDYIPDPNAPGIALRIPCQRTLCFYGGETPDRITQLKKEHARRIDCPKYEEPSDADITKDKADTDAAIKRMRMSVGIIAKVKKEHKGSSWQGIEICPVCGGKLHMSHAAVNGHVWGRCETQNCLNWME